jgi:SAM-dependent methyltransferase
MQTDYAIRYRDLYQQHWWWQARELAILQEIRALGFRENGAARILDIGCGDGLIFDRLEPFGEVWGVEGDPATLSAEGRWRHRIHQQRFDDSFRPGCQYDLILMLDVLEHLPDPQAALVHARSLLTPSGRLLVTVPALQALWTSHDDINHHFVRYDRRSLRRLTERSGVVLEKAQYFFHWTCPVKLLLRLKEAVLHSAAGLPAVPPAWINRLCFLLSRLEQHTLTRLMLPFGSSLLGIARR